jgi:hypothetical protein
MDAHIFYFENHSCFSRKQIRASTKQICASYETLIFFFPRCSVILLKRKKNSLNLGKTKQKSKGKKTKQKSKTQKRVQKKVQMERPIHEMWRRLDISLDKLSYHKSDLRGLILFEGIARLSWSREILKQKVSTSTELGPFSACERSLQVTHISPVSFTQEKRSPLHPPALGSQHEAAGRRSRHWHPLFCKVQ